MQKYRNKNKYMCAYIQIFGQIYLFIFLGFIIYHFNRYLILVSDLYFLNTNINFVRFTKRNKKCRIKYKFCRSYVKDFANIARDTVQVVVNKRRVNSWRDSLNNYSFCFNLIIVVKFIDFI